MPRKNGNIPQKLNDAEHIYHRLVYQTKIDPAAIYN